MTGEELFEIWAPGESVWSQWASPVLFAQIACSESDPRTPGTHELPSQAQPNVAGNAVIVDLPGGTAIQAALGLAERGYRPIPIINASPGPFAHKMGESAYALSQSVVLDMSGVVHEICIGTPRLRQIRLSAHASPVFVLDSLRLKGTQAAYEYMFDNRWMVFPQDFPSAKFLSERGIRRVTVLQEKIAQPLEDLAHVLLRWQHAGLEVYISTDESTEKITVATPSRFKASWYRALAMLGLRRNSAGGFGSIIPAGSAG